MVRLKVQTKLVLRDFRFLSSTFFVFFFFDDSVEILNLERISWEPLDSFEFLDTPAACFFGIETQG